MAESKNNVLSHGLSGMVGDMIVFRQRGSKTFVANAPKDSTKPPTKGQQQVRTRFQQGIIYGKTAIGDAATKGSLCRAGKTGANCL